MRLGGRFRWIAAALVVALGVLVFVGCNDPVEQFGADSWSPPPREAPRWTGGPMPVARPGGALSAPGFNALVDAGQPAWASSAEAALAELLMLGGGEGPSRLYLRRGTDDGRPELTVTFAGLGDDSIAAERYTVVFTRDADGRHRFASGRRTQKCRSGRGHQTFSTESCQ